VARTCRCRYPCSSSHSAATHDAQPLGEGADPEWDLVPLAQDANERLNRRISQTRSLQRRAADARLADGYLDRIWTGKASIGNEDVYFVGHSFIRLLWRTWSERCPDFANSISFLRVLLWLSHSGFDDMVPDWRPPLDEFCRRLEQEHADFLRCLLDLAPDKLAELAKAATSPQANRYDLWRRLKPNSKQKTQTWQAQFAGIWRRLRTGSAEPSAIELWQSRVTRLQREFAETVTLESARYVRRYRKIFAELTNTMVANGILHVLSESEFEFRMIASDKWLVGAGRSPDGTKFGRFMRSLDDADYQRLAAESRVKGDGVGRIFQLLLARPDPLLSRRLGFLTALQYGAVLLVWDSQHERVPDSIIKLVAWFLGDQFKKARDSLAASINIGKDEDSRSLIQSFVADDRAARQLEASIRQATRPLIDTHVTHIVRLYLATIVGEDEVKVDRLSKERIGALLPPDPLENSRALRLIGKPARSRDGVSRSLLAEQMEMTPAQLAGLIEAIHISAGLWNQKLIEEDGDIVRAWFPDPITRVPLGSSALPYEP
jgi:hypothetical protein